MKKRTQAMKKGHMNTSILPGGGRLLGSVAAALTLMTLPATAASLSLHLDFDNNTNDQSGNGLTTTATAGMSFSSDVPAAIGSGNSGSFNPASDSWVDVAANPLINGNQFTLMYFVKAGAQNGSFDRFTSRGDFEFDTAISNTGELSYFSRAIGSWQSSGTLIPIDSTTWTHIAWQDNNTTTTLYVNGTAVFTGPSNQPLAGFMRIGAVQTGVIGNNEGFNGLMDDLAWFDDATDPLTPTDIAFIANNGVQAFLIPEPSSLLMLAGCGIFAAARRRRH